MDINSVKIDVGAKTVTIGLTRQNQIEGSSTPEKVPAFVCPDAPAKTFRTALTNLKGDFIFLMDEVIDPEQRDKVTVHGVNFVTKGGREQFQILGGINPEMGYCSLNTPFLWAPGDGKSGPRTLTEEQVKRLRKVRVEAAKYVDGNRARQLTLDDESEAQEAEEEAAAGAGAK